MQKTLLHLFFIFSFSFGYSQNWGEQEILHPNPGTENNYPNGINAPNLGQEYTGDTFGFTVEISGNYAAISAPNKHLQLGVVHLYKKDANGVWNHLQEIIEHTGRQWQNFFGHSLAFNGDYLFVGSPAHRIDEARYESPAGAVLVYKKDANDNYVGTQILRSSDISHQDSFGQNISSNGEFLFVGDSGEDGDENGNNIESGAGAVYVFKIDANGNWQETQKIVPSFRGAGHRFGKTLDSGGDYLIVGSGDDTDVNNQNPNTDDDSVIIFKKDANDVWNQTQKIKASDPDNGSNFGIRGVTISGDFIAVGSDYELLENNKWYFGAVYIFKKDANGTWNETQLIKNENSSSFLGTSVAMDGNLLIASDAGFTIKDANGVTTHSKAGAATLFVKNNADSWVFVDQFTMANPEANLNATGGAIANGGGSSKGFNQVGISGNTFLFGVPQKDRVINGVTKVRVGAAYFSGDVDALGLLAAATLSVDENKSLTIIKGYPNPTQNNFYINLVKTYEKIEITVTNLLGKTVFNKNYQQKNSIALQLNNLAKGIYLVKIDLKNNGLKVMKIMKQ